MISIDQREYSDTESAIFLAALDVFGEHGKSGARMRDIARRAGINPALVHYYFRSKDRLYEEVFSYMLRTHFMVLSASLSKEKDFASQLRAFICTYMDMLERTPALVGFMTRELSTGATNLAVHFARVANDPAFPPRAFLLAVERAIRRREIRKVDPMQTLITVLGSCVYFYLAIPLLKSIAPDIAGDPAAFAARRREHIFDLVYHGLSTRRTHA
ncbi:MAG: TetR family transcriptional regulator [Ignavibacteriae bacterium]|nr:TetR family transcriptional regulator [Ignavibacteriota bacterium]